MSKGPRIPKGYLKPSAGLDDMRASVNLLAAERARMIVEACSLSSRIEALEEAVKALGGPVMASEQIEQRGVGNVP